MQPINGYGGSNAVCNDVDDLHPLSTHVVCERAKLDGVTFGWHIEITLKSGTQLAHPAAEIEIRTSMVIVGLLIF